MADQGVIIFLELYPMFTFSGQFYGLFVASDPSRVHPTVEKRSEKKKTEHLLFSPVEDFATHFLSPLLSSFVAFNLSHCSSLTLPYWVSFLFLLGGFCKFNEGDKNRGREEHHVGCSLRNISGYRMALIIIGSLDMTKPPTTQFFFLSHLTDGHRFVNVRPAEVGYEDLGCHRNILSCTLFFQRYFGN